MSLRKIAFFSFLLITSSCDYSCPPASNDYTTVMEEYTEWENQNVLCPACGGSGVFTYYYSEICATCGGTGRVTTSVPVIKKREVEKWNGNLSSLNFRGNTNRINKVCNLSKHECPGYSDTDNDKICDGCQANGYSCHAVNHSSKKH